MSTKMRTTRTLWAGVPGPKRRQAGTTLIELLVAAGLGTVVLLAIMIVVLFSARSFSALVNYVDLDNFSRSALDEMTTEIRQADRLLAGDATQMDFQFTNPSSGAQFLVRYVYDPDSRTLSRVQGTQRRVLLEECDFLRFDFFQRNSIPNSFDLYETAPAPLVRPRLCKAVQMRWVCSRTILGQAVNTESVQSARVVIRKR